MLTMYRIISRLRSFKYMMHFSTFLWLTFYTVPWWQRGQPQRLEGTKFSICSQNIWFRRWSVWSPSWKFCTAILNNWSWSQNDLTRSPKIWSKSPKGRTWSPKIWSRRVNIWTMRGKIRSQSLKFITMSSKVYTYSLIRLLIIEKVWIWSKIAKCGKLNLHTHY